MCLLIKTERERITMFEPHYDYEMIDGYTLATKHDNIDDVKKVITQMATRDIVCYKIMTMRIKEEDNDDGVIIDDIIDQDSPIPNIETKKHRNKKFRVDYFTPYQGYKMYIGENYKTSPLSLEYIRKHTYYHDDDQAYYTEIQGGVFHSFKTLGDASFHLPGAPYMGFWDNKPCTALSKYQYENVIVECTIPKGSIFYEGLFDGEVPSYASCEICLEKVVEPHHPVPESPFYDIY